MTITEVIVNNEAFTANVEPEVEGKVFRVDVKTKPPMSMGRVQANVTVRTDHPSYKEVNLPVAVTVVGKLAIAPQEIVLVEQANVMPVTRYVVVRPGKVTSFKIDEVIPPKGVEVQLLPMGQNGYRIQLDNLMPTGDSNGQTVKIRTDVEGMEEVEIPIKVVPIQPAT